MVFPGQIVSRIRKHGACLLGMGPALLLTAAPFLSLFPRHPFDHRFGQVHQKQAQQEKDHKGQQHLKTGGQAHIIQYKPVKKVNSSSGKHRQQGEHIHQRGKEDIGDAAAAGTLIFPLAFQGPGPNQIHPFFAIGASGYSKILHSNQPFRKNFRDWIRGPKRNRAGPLPAEAG